MLRNNSINMNSELKKVRKINIRLPSSEEILYFLSISAFMLIIIYLLGPDIVVPIRIKPIYREYSSTFFSNFVSFFYSVLVANSAFKPIWFIFWPVFFYFMAKKFLKKKKKVKYYLLIFGILFAYAFYTIPNHSIAPFFYVYKPPTSIIDQEFSKLCEKKSVMLFAPPTMFLMQSEFGVDVYANFKDIYSNYVSSPINYVCVGNGTSVNIGFDWNPDKLYCPDKIQLRVSTERYEEILGQPPSLFPMFVLDCKYIIYPQSVD